MMFPSYSEGFGIVLIEAQAMGVRCYASNTVPKATQCGGVRFLDLKDGEKVWAEEIIKEMNFQKENYHCESFSINSVMEKYNKIYGGDDV